VKCVSLWQPWASAIAVGVKHYETRGWLTRHRGLLAIHAAKRWKPDEPCPFHMDIPVVPPLGAVVAVARLIACHPAEAMRGRISATEAEWGNYGDGRFAWELQEVHPLLTPVPLCGKQGLFNLPPDVEAAVLAQLP
jgi:activating signal cointegrator 1